MAPIPRPLRRALIEAMGGSGPFTVREIANLFEDHGFDQTAQIEPEQGVRRTTAAEYLEPIDWDDRENRRRLTGLVEEVLAFYPPPEQPQAGDVGERLRRTWARAMEAPPGEQLAERPVEQDQEYARTTDQDDPYDIWPADRVRLFFSHTAAHKEFVGDVATVLEKWPMTCFVAHEVIEPSLEWQQVIESALRTCQAFVAFVTEDFVGSKWCDQETGWALGRGIVIVPIRLEADPHGFIGGIQAIPARLDDAPAVMAEKIATALATAAFRTTRPGAVLLADPLADAIVEQFCGSLSFDLTRRRFAFLQQIPMALWTPERRLRVEASCEENRQIREAGLDGGLPVPDAVRALWG